MGLELERCVDCDDPTGRAGRADDSLYCDCGAGPFCGECHDEHGKRCEEADDPWPDGVCPECKDPPGRRACGL